MIANRRSRGTTSRKSSTRLPARSDCWVDWPVTLPPGCARLATRPPPTGSSATAKTMGMTDVACFNVATAGPFVTMTSTLSRTNSAAISATRSERPSDQRYSIAMVRPSIQPSARSRSAKAVMYALHAVASAPRNPMVGAVRRRSEDDYDVLADGVVVGRIMRAILAAVGSPWFWTLAYGYHHDRRPTHGYAATREAAMVAFAKSWRRE